MADKLATDPATNHAYQGFGGEINRIFSTSTPWWPERPTAPDRAPNVIVMLVDDLGFSDVGCFGSEIPTPNIDALADAGVRFTNFHVNPMCSPTRASLLTGLNAHLAGVGHVAHADPGFPGYAMELRPGVPTMADFFRDSGWATFCIGKWHLCKDSDLSDAASKHSWPLQVGFDRYYGILDGFTNFHQPHRLYEDNHVIEVDEYPDDYYFTDDLTDQAIDMITRLRTSHPTKPFFCFFAHGAVHAPLHAKQSDIDTHRGRYDDGWDQIRNRRFAQQKRLGIVDEATVLPGRNTEVNHDVDAWDDLTDDERRLYARYMETYAAMVDNVDQNLGRLRTELEAIGEWDNTIVVFTSDNGASREGQARGTAAYFRTLQGAARNKSEGLSPEDLARIDQVGGPTTMPHYPRGWAMASNTPFRLYKVNTHQGGHQVPFIMSWPQGDLDEGSIRRPYQHVTDLLPTLAEMVGLDLDESELTPPRAGSSLASVLADPTSGSTHPEQIYECWGHRGYYRQGWSATTCHVRPSPFSDDHWELHDLTTDPTETNDLGDVHPEKLIELVEAWEEAAWANQIFPLDEGSMLKEITRPPTEQPLSTGLRLRPGVPTIERYRSLKLIQFRSFDVVVSLDFSQGDAGVLFAHGDQGGGYSMRIEDDRLLADYNNYGVLTTIDCGVMPTGDHQVVFALTPQTNLRADVEIRLGDKVIAGRSDLAQLMGMAPFQGIDVGIDRRSPVSWPRYQRRGSDRYQGNLHQVEWIPGEEGPESPSRFSDLLREMYAKYD